MACFVVVGASCCFCLLQLTRQVAQRLGCQPLGWVAALVVAENPAVAVAPDLARTPNNFYIRLPRCAETELRPARLPCVSEPDRERLYVARAKDSIRAVLDEQLANS